MKIVRPDGTVIVTDSYTPVLQVSMPDCSAFVVNAIFGEATGIEEVMPQAPDSKVYELYDISGRRSVGKRPAGVYIQRTVDGKTRKVLIAR